MFDKFLSVVEDMVKSSTVTRFVLSSDDDLTSNTEDSSEVHSLTQSPTVEKI
jgi:hypothetical protein